MNPNWIVVRPGRHPISPLKRGAAEVESYGLHVASKGDTYRITTSQPNNCTTEAIVAGPELTLYVLALLEGIAVGKRDRQQVVVWVHDLADSITTLFRGFARAFACSTEPVVVWAGGSPASELGCQPCPGQPFSGSPLLTSGLDLPEPRTIGDEPDAPPGRNPSTHQYTGLSVQWQGYHEAQAGRVELIMAEQPLDSEEASPAQLAASGCLPFRLSLLRGPIGAATLTFEGHKSIRLLDSQAFIRSDLQSRDVRGIVAHVVKAAEQGIQGIRPAHATRVLGERIAEVWTLLDVAPSPTPAATGAKLFRRHFLQKPLYRHPYHVESAAELSFHGGKVGLWVPKGSKIRRVHVYDMRSAYAAAMMTLPSFLSGEWKRYNMQQACSLASLQQVPPGFFRVSGNVTGCQWPLIPSHNGEWTSGSIERTWITSYELVESLRSKELDLYECFGWVWQESNVAGSEAESSHWARFSQEIFRRRDLCTDALRTVYKGTLVGLYGKTVQRTAVPPVPPDGEAYEHGVPIVYCNHGEPNSRRPQYFRAGGFYYPVVGSLTTGAVRAWVHRIEHDYEAVHTAVDAVHTLRELPDEMIGPGLGQWRHLGTGTARYHGPNNYTVVGLHGWRKHAASGVARKAGTDDLREAIL